MGLLMFRHFYLFVAFFLMVVPPSMAASNIGVVDDQKILLQSAAAKSIQKQVKVLRERYYAEFSSKEQEFLADEKALIAERENISKDEFAKKVQAFERRNIEVQRLAQSKKRDLDKASVDAVDRLREALFGVVQEILNERGFELVITHQNVIVGQKSIDVTDETMERLNAKVPYIEVVLDTSSDDIVEAQ